MITLPYAGGLAATPAARWSFALTGLEGVSVPYAALPQRRAMPYSRLVWKLVDETADAMGEPGLFQPTLWQFRRRSRDCSYHRRRAAAHRRMAARPRLGSVTADPAPKSPTSQRTTRNHCDDECLGRRLSQRG